MRQYRSRFERKLSRRRIDLGLLKRFQWSYAICSESGVRKSPLPAQSPVRRVASLVVIVAGPVNRASKYVVTVVAIQNLVRVTKLGNCVIAMRDVRVGADLVCASL